MPVPLWIAPERAAAGHLFSFTVVRLVDCNKLLIDLAFQRVEKSADSLVGIQAAIDQAIAKLKNQLVRVVIEDIGHDFRQSGLNLEIVVLCIAYIIQVGLVRSDSTCDFPDLQNHLVHCFSVHGAVDSDDISPAR